MSATTDPAPQTRVRDALVVASDEFDDVGLARLRAPAHDAEALSRVLGDPRIGAFAVTTLQNEPSHLIARAIEDFFADRRPDDLLLLHLSCHGVKDESGELHFASSDTQLGRLASTSVPASFVSRLMNRSRSRRIVLLLDCCYAGAFERGFAARGGLDVGIGEQLGGRGRAVITASNAMEYAFEGADVTDTGTLAAPSVFTSAIVEGLETGEADHDQDGLVSLNELYDFVFARVRERTPNQTPSKWVFGVQGELFIARRPGPVTSPAPLPDELRAAIDNPFKGVRLGAVQELERLLGGRHAGQALAARQALEALVDDDSRTVSAAAAAALASHAHAASPEHAPVTGVANPPEAEVAQPPDADVAHPPDAQATEPPVVAERDGEPASPEPASPEPGLRQPAVETTVSDVADAAPTRELPAVRPPGPADGSNQPTREVTGPPLESPTSPDVIATGGRPQRGGRRPRPMLAAGAGLAVLAVAAVAWWWPPGNGPAQPEWDPDPVAVSVATPPPLDASGDGWEAVPRGETTSSIREPPEGFGSSWALGWDADHLYVLVEVQDPDIDTGNAAEPWDLIHGDGVNLILGAGVPDGANPDLPLRDDDVLVTLGPADLSEGTAVAGLRPAGSIAGAEGCGGSDRVFDRERGRDVEMATAAQATVDGYRLEAAIPWSVVGVTPRAGERLGAILTVADKAGEAGQPSSRSTGALSTHPDRERDKHCPARWQSLELHGPA